MHVVDTGHQEQAPQVWLAISSDNARDTVAQRSGPGRLLYNGRVELAESCSPKTRGCKLLYVAVF